MALLDDQRTRNLNRRSFVALSTAAAGAALFAGSKKAHASDASTTSAGAALGDADVNFSQEVDVLIAGAGISGMMAALDPAGAGLSTLLVEQNGFAGGDSIYSAACMMCSTAKLTQEERPEKYSTVEELREKFAPYYENDEKALDKLMQLQEAGGNFIDLLHYDWGYEFQPKMECPYQQAFFPKNGICTMSDIFELIDQKITEAGASYLFNTTLKTLIADENGTIVGARFTDENGAYVDIKAKAVVLACGGYASNQEWMTAYAPDTADLGCIVSGRTGEGIKAGMAAGGVLYGMASPGNLNPRYEAGHMLGVHYPILALLPNGKRFYCETAVHNAATGCIAAGWHEWWTIWDSTAQNGVDQEVIKHAGDNVKTANSIEELAEGMGMSLDILQAAFDNWNKICEDGVDPDFERTLFLQPLEPPYYYLLNVPVRYKSVGGLDVSERYEVIDESGTPIPGLYACGCTAGTTDIVPAAASGMIVGSSVAEDLA
jgi:fumarate reductase flavoprotein subunit